MTPSDIALVSLGTTPGLRRADDALAEGLRAGGASCEVVRVQIGAAGRLRRHPALTDLVEALAARRTAATAATRGRVLLFSTVTSALLAQPRGPYAVRFDSPAALNRPAGAGGAWQRARERRVLAGASLLVPYGEVAAAAARRVLGGRRIPPLVCVPVPVEAPPAAATRDLDAVAYAGYPRKRGLDVLCRAWAEARPPDGRLLVAGVTREAGLRWLGRCGVPEPPGVEWAGPLPRAEWLAALARARTFVNASRWEDFGQSQLEALAAGAPLVTVASPGAYEALPLARELAPALVAERPEGLAGALRAGLALDDAARERYAAEATRLLAPYAPAAIERTLAERVLPALRAAA